MNPDRLLKHFEAISEGEDAVPRLRRFIVDLAVRGKLLDQVQNDEPAPELLKSIQAKKAELIKQGEIKKEKLTSAINEAELPFRLPTSWAWERLSSLTSYIQRGKSPQYSSGDGLPVISQKCVQWDGLRLEFAKKITRSSLKGYEPIRFLRDGDLLWNSTGTGTIGRIIRVNNPPEKLVCDSHVTIVRCLLVNENFIRLWLSSDHVYGVIEDRAAGTTNQVELTAAIANNQITPVPPLAEQDRIVAKVDELMALCDELEAARTQRETRRDHLVAATLHRLNNGYASSEAGKDADFKQTARFYFNHLPRLAIRPEHIKQLRQTVLDLAMRGRLVTQDKSSQPASELLKEIDESKQRLIKMGKAKSSGQMPAIKPDELPFPLPQGWEWVRLGQIGEFINGDRSKNYPNKNEYVANGVPWINTGHIEPDGSLTNADMYFISRKKFESLNSGKIEPGDLVYCLRGATFGKTAIVDPYREGAIASSLMIIRPYSPCSNRYLYYYLISPLGRSQIFRFDNGSAQPNLSANSVRLYVYPLPPLAEQHRIVAKVNELMALCDELEAQLTTTATTRRQLLEAILHDAVSA